MNRPYPRLKYLVIHHSATPEDWNVEDIRYIHKMIGFQDVGYHYLVNREGMHTGRDIADYGAHALGDKEPYLEEGDHDERYMNRVGVGLCIIGDFRNKPPDTLDPAKDHRTDENGNGNSHNQIKNIRWFRSLRLNKTVQARGQVVDLEHIADTERRKSGKYRKHNCKRLEPAAHPQFDIVHRSAMCFSGFVNATVTYSQRT